MLTFVIYHYTVCSPCTTSIFTIRHSAPSPYVATIVRLPDYGLTANSILAQPYPPNTHFGNTPILQDACRWLDSYFLGQRPLHMPPLAPEGTLFRQQIWQLLSHINYGCTTTYGALGNKWAHQQGRNTFSAQAVGNAIDHNPISIFIPCHRVIGSNGNLIGYAGGIDRKIALLKLERAVL